jgi:hypothetical protein
MFARGGEREGGRSEIPLAGDSVNPGLQDREAGRLTYHALVGDAEAVTHTNKLK